MADPLRIDDVVDALAIMRDGKIREVPSGAGELRVFRDWKEGLPTFDRDRLLHAARLWSRGKKRHFPSPADLLDVLETEVRSEARKPGSEQQEKLGTGARKPVPDQARAFGREWVARGRRYREYTTTMGRAPAGSGVPPNLAELGYVELFLEPGESTDQAGRRYVGDMAYRPFAPGGHLFRNRLAIAPIQHVN